MRRGRPRLAALVTAVVLMVGVGCSDTGAGQWTPHPSATATDVVPTSATSGAQPGTNPLCRTAEARPPVEGGLPDLRFDCLGGGGQASLTGLAQGRGVVINVWAQWCGPCRHEAPVLSEVSRTAVGKVDFWGINFTDPKPDLAIQFAKESGWDYPQLADPEGQFKPQAPAVPTTLFVSAQGRVVARHFGVLDSTAELEALIRRHLGVTL